MFLSLINKYFPASNKLHKVFNHNTVKVSYSCMGNMKSAINQHNMQILPKKDQPSNSAERKCDCKNSYNCPLQGNCLAFNIVYKAEISTSDNEKKIYIGMTSNSFKKRYRNHQKSFINKEYKNETEPSKFIWGLKLKKRHFTLSWSNLSCASAYQSGASKLKLCLEGKLQLIIANKKTLLNKRQDCINIPTQDQIQD